MDEDKTKDQTQESEELETSASTATEEPTEVEEEAEAPQETAEEAESAEQTEEPAEEPEPTPRENKRIQELTRKLAESQQPRPTQRPQQRQIIDEGDYDIDQINGMAQKYGDERFSEGVSQAKALEFKVGLELDAPRVAQKYAVFDQDSEKFDPGIAAFVNESYLKSVGYDPNTGTVQNNNIRYSEYVEGFMEAVETLSAGRAADSTRNLTKQAAQTGVRPTGVAKKEYSGTDPSKMTLEQLQAAALQEAKTIRF